MADKDIERAYLNLARSIHPEFPPGDPLNSETSDFLWPNRRLGLELRRLSHPQREGGVRHARLISSISGSRNSRKNSTSMLSP